MKLVVDATHEVGQRAARVLLAERDVEYIGLWNDEAAGRAVRSGPTSTLDGYDAVVSDRELGYEDLVARAAVAGIPVVLWSDALDIPNGPAACPTVTGANVGSALATALVHHPVADVAGDDRVTMAWTEPGSPLRNGHPMAFPDPVGMSWTARRDESSFVAFRDDQWAGAVVRVEGESGDRVIGVADHASHLEAVVLASTVLIAASGAYDDGVRPASVAGEHLMNKLRDVELDFAVWRSSV